MSSFAKIWRHVNISIIEKSINKYKNEKNQTELERERERERERGVFLVELYIVGSGSTPRSQVVRKGGQCSEASA